jgi:hypothetical protein
MFVSAALGGTASSVILCDPPSAAWGLLAVNAVVAILVAIQIGTAYESEYSWEGISKFMRVGRCNWKLGGSGASCSHG